MHIKFGKNRSVTLEYISILVGTENIDTIFLLQFLTPGGMKRTKKNISAIGKKNFSAIEKKNKLLAYSNICPS